MNAKYIIPALVVVAAASFAQDAAWIPENAFGAMKMDAKKLSEKPLFKKAGEKALAMGFAQGQTESMPLQSISNEVATVLVTFVPNGSWSPFMTTGSAEAPFSTITYICGTFDNAKVTDGLKALPSCKTAEVDGATLYSFVVEAPGMANSAAPVPGMTNSTIYASFPKKGTLVLSEKYETLLAGLKVVEGKAPAIKGNSNIAKAISKGDPLDLVVDLKAIGAAYGNGKELPSEAPSVVHLTLRDKVATPDMLLSVSVVMGSAEIAEQGATQANALKGSVGAQLAANPDAAPFLKAFSDIDISAKGDTIVGTLTLDEALLDALLNLAQTAQARMEEVGAGAVPGALPPPVAPLAVPAK